MRQFILGASVASLTSGTVQSKTDSDAGKVGVGYYPSGIATFDTGANIKDKAFVALIRTAAQGGNVVLPLYKNHFSYSKMVYSAPAAFTATLVIPSPSSGDTDFTVIAAKKGVKFNERNKWTANVHLKGSESASDIADKIVAYFMDGAVARYGISVANSSGTLTFTAVDGSDWKIIPADDLIGVTLTVTQAWDPGKGTADMVKDMADKAAADAGFEYTYQEPGSLLYPNYPIGAAGAFTGTYTIFTLRFAEPREMKTVDEIVHQIIQVAFPVGADAITTFENACKYLAGETVGE